MPKKAIKNTAEENKQTSEPNSGVTPIWIYQRELGKTATSMLRTLIEQVGKTHEDRQVI